MDKYEPRFWKEDVRVGQTVTLSDPQALKDSLDAGEGAAARDYIVKAIQIVTNDLGIEWRFFEMYDSEETLFLLVKSVDDAMDLRVYFEPPEFETGNRRDVLDTGQRWLFQEPEDPDDFRFDKLEYTLTIGAPVVPNEYERKRVGALFGELSFLPPRPEMGDCLAQIVEYQSQEECENPEILILESGGESGDEGGYIMLLLGAPISPEDVEIL